MRVQVTRDSWGICVWHMWVDLVYTKPTFRNLTRHGIPVAEQEGTKCWLPKRTSLFRREKVFSDRQTTKYFPELRDKFGAGEKRITDLVISVTSGQ